MPLIVIRQLQSMRPVAFAVIMESTDLAVDDQDHYMHSIADDQIAEFKKMFVEFENADFYTAYIPPSKVL